MVKQDCLLVLILVDTKSLAVMVKQDCLLLLTLV